MMFDWQTLVAIGALAVAAATFFSRVLSGSLTRAEHEEFRNAVLKRTDEQQRLIEERVVIREFESWLAQMRLDISLLRNAVTQLDATKPTTGELDRAATALAMRMAAVEDRIKVINDRLFFTADKPSRPS